MNSSGKRSKFRETQSKASQHHRWASQTRNIKANTVQVEAVDQFDKDRKTYEQIQLNHDTSEDSASNKKSRRDMKDTTTINTTKNTTQKGFQKTQ